MRIIVTAFFFCCFAMYPYSAGSGEMPDYRAIWKAWGVEGQNAYLSGVTDGSSHALFALMEEISSTSGKRGVSLPKDFYENIRKKSAVMFDENKLRDVITDLYKDPANSYIWHEDMVYIARNILNGDDVSEELREARKSAINNYELNSKMRNK